MYAFGVLLWEMMSGKRAWDGLTPAQVMLAVALQKQTLKYPPNAHSELARQGPYLGHLQSWSPLMHCGICCHICGASGE